MTEPGQLEIKEQLSQVDPRVFFKNTIFQKRGEELDNNKTHEWNRVIGGGFWVENSYGTVLVGETATSFVDKQSEWGLLMVCGRPDDSVSSTYSNKLNQDSRGRVMDSLHTITPCFSDDLRHRFAKFVISEIPNLHNERYVTLKLMRAALEMLPNYHNSFTVKVPDFWKEFETQPSPDQQRLLLSFMEIVARKMPLVDFQTKIAKMEDDWRYVQEPTGFNFQSIFSDSMRWVLENREDTKINFSLMDRPNPKPFPVRDQIQKTFNNKDELLAELLKFPCDAYPNYRTDNAKAEIVPLELVCGGSNMSNWTVSREEGRGLSRIFDLTQKFSNGISITDTDQPIQVTEVNGKYYVSSDGRHRTAALKALGVKKVPMLVAHSFRQNTY